MYDGVPIGQCPLKNHPKNKMATRSKKYSVKNNVEAISDDRCQWDWHCEVHGSRMRLARRSNGKAKFV